ncbi:hypothetical protein [Carboxydocella sp. ULO1]|nr:hypothetical protein [Carboxydocella sp. ULO1]GAW29385.1 hypothetical protein ULO1_19550 [Carboxydocella sp. ULO1]
MQIYFGRGAMYAKVEEGDQIQRVPIELGDKTLHPGQYVKRLGHKKRSSFEMKDGWYLRYEGRIDEILLFSVNAIGTEGTDNFYYAFVQITPNDLLVQSAQNAFYDVHVEWLEVYDEVPMQETMQQLSLF